MGATWNTVTNIRNLRISGNNMSDLISNMKEQGYEMDSAYTDAMDDDDVLFYKNGETYTARINRYWRGGAEIYNIKKQD